MKKPLAVFDIDGTLYRGSLLIDLVERLVQKGIFKKEVQEEYWREREAWKVRKGSYTDYITNTVSAFAKNIKGHAYGEVADTAGEVIERRHGYVHRFSRDYIQKLKNEGYYLLAVSHSPKLIVDGFAYENGFDKAYGTLYETGPQAQFTGNILEEHLIFNKANVVKRVVEKENVTLDGSIGVGDTESDVPMLELVETPTAFNPNSVLYKHAQRLGWNVVVERKDVIYEIEK